MKMGNVLGTPEKITYITSLPMDIRKEILLSFPLHKVLILSDVIGLNLNDDDILDWLTMNYDVEDFKHITRAFSSSSTSVQNK